MRHVAVELRTSTELDGLRAAGQVVGDALRAVRDHAHIGVRLDELDEVARSVIDATGAVPVFLGYHPNWAPRPYPGTICTSVNDAVVHGIPDSTRLRDGDLVSVDCGARLHGWCADAAVTFTAGTAADENLLRAGRTALADGIAAAQPGGRVGDIAHAIGVVGRSAGFGIPADLGGHGVGRAMHEAPFVPNEGPPGRGVPLRPGMVIAIEPILLAGGGDEVETDADGWTVRTRDSGRAVHVEHTVAITEDGPRVLTEL